MHNSFHFNSKCLIVAVKSPSVPYAPLLQSFKLRRCCILRHFHSNSINAAPLQHICEGRALSPNVQTDSRRSVWITMTLLIQDETKGRQDTTNLFSFHFFSFLFFCCCCFPQPLFSSYSWLTVRARGARMTDGSHQLRLDWFFPLNSEGHVQLLVENIKVVTRRVDDSGWG